APDDHKRSTFRHSLLRHSVDFSLNITQHLSYGMYCRNSKISNFAYFFGLLRIFFPASRVSRVSRVFKDLSAIQRRLPMHSLPLTPLSEELFPSCSFLLLRSFFGGIR